MLDVLYFKEYRNNFKPKMKYFPSERISVYFCQAFGDTSKTGDLKSNSRFELFCTTLMT